MELFIAAWLGRIFRAAGGEAVDWPLLLKLHPLIEGEYCLSPREVGARARELCRKGSWSRLRRAVETGEMPHSSITAEAAAWMDDSMFARWCLASFPCSAELEGRLGEMLPADLHQKVVECLDEQRG